MKWFFFCLLSVIGYDQLRSQHDTIVVSEDLQAVDISPYIYYFKDTTGVVTIQDIHSPSSAFHFQQDVNQIISKKGMDTDIHPGYNWVRLHIRSVLEQNKKMWLHLDFPYLEFYKNVNGRWIKETGGYLDHKNKNNIFQSINFQVIELTSDSSSTYYYKIPADYIQVPFGLSHKLDMQLLHPDQAIKKINSYWWENIFILGIILAIAFYHLLFYIFRWRKEYLYFALFLISYALIFSSFSSILSEWVINGKYNDYLICLVAIGWTLFYIFHYLFTQHLLNIELHFTGLSSLWKKLLILRILLAILIIVFVLTAGGMTQLQSWYFKPFLMIVGILGIALVTLPFLISFLSWRKHIPMAGIYLIAMIAFIIQLINAELDFQGLITLPDWYPHQGGLIMMVFLFALGIAQRLKMLEEKKTLAEEARLKEEMELQKVKEMEQFRSRFFTNITHEFRTPLTIILGITEEIKNNPTNWMQKGLKMISENGTKLLNLISQMLEISKLETSNYPVHNISSDIISHLKYLVYSHQSMAENKNIDISIDSHPESLVMNFDPDIIATIMNNLLTNALKYTQKGGKVQVIICSDGDHLQVSIKDTGIGIPEEKLPYIFDRYYQAKPDQQRGFGIGLSLTKELIKVIDGTITVSSLTGKGSVFTFTLPMQKSKKESPKSNFLFSEKTEETTPGKQRHLLLIIDDHPDIITYLQSLLSHKYKLLVARDGQEGLEKAFDHIPDLIISDVMMPELDGYAMCQQLKEDFRTNHIPIILMTAKADVSSRITGIKKGADAYLAKPFNNHELYALIDKLIDLREKLKQKYADVNSLFSKSHPSIKEDEDQFMNKVFNNIVQNISDPNFGINDLAKALQMSRAQLYRKFSAINQYTLAEFIKKVRMHKAKELLLNSTMNITQISIETGFKNLSTFTTNFSAEFGMTPSDFRKAETKNKNIETG